MYGRAKFFKSEHHKKNKGRHTKKLKLTQSNTNCEESFTSLQNIRIV